MPLSFEATKTRSTLIDLLQAPTFKDINYADKTFWSAHFGSEIDELKEEIKNGLSPKDVKKRLEDFQGMVGRLALSPVVYGLGLLDLQKFLRAEIEKSEAYLAAIKEIRRDWRETLRKNPAFALENFATDALMAVRHVAKDEWDVQTGREALAYYYGVIANPCYEETVTIAKTFFNDFFTEKYDEISVRITNVLTKREYREVLENLHKIFAYAVAQLPRGAVAVTKAEEIKATDSADTTAKSYLDKAWSSAKTLAQYVIDHPAQVITAGLAAQATAVAAFNGIHSFNKRAVGVEFRVNTYTNNYQQNPSVASLTNGNFVVAWESSTQDVGSTPGIYGQVFNSTAGLLGSEFHVNTYTTGQQVYPAVAGLTNDNFVVIWQSYNQDGSFYGIYGQLFNSNAGLIGSEFQVNTETSSDQANAAVTGLTNGNFVVVWQSNGNSQDGSSYGIFGQLFNTNAGLIGSEFRVNTYITNSQEYPAAASLTNGNYVVVWQSREQEGATGSGHYGIYGQLFNSNAGLIGSEFHVNTYTSNTKQYPAVTSLANGNFVVVWQSFGQESPSGEFGIYGQLFNSNAGKIGSEFLVNTYTTSDQEYPAIASLTNSNFVVVWQSQGQEGTFGEYGIYGQVFNSNAGYVGSEYRVNTNTANNQVYAAAAVLTDGNFVVAWQTTFEDSYGKILRTSLTANNLNQAISYIEDTTYNLADITITTPVFLTNATATLTLSNPTAGQLTTGTSGSVTSTYNSGTGVWRASGTTVTDVNILLANVQLIPSLNYNSNFLITSLIENGFSSSLTGTMNVVGSAVNDAPLNTVPAAQTTNEDAAKVFNIANGNALSVDDVDAGTNPLQITLTATNGAITLGGTTGLTFTTGDGTADNTMTFKGTASNVNTALNGLSFNPTANFNGAASLQIQTDDQGYSGSGGTLSDTDTIAITVNAVNDTPVNTVPSPQTTNEDNVKVFSSANGNAISVSDIDAGTNPMQVTLTATNGAITLGGTTGLTFTTGDGTADSNMVFTGTASNINTALNGLSFNPTANFNGAASLQIQTNDQGNSGSGGALTDNDTVNITVNAVNDAPVNTMPSAQTTNEDTAKVFSSANGNAISVSDLDAGTNPMQVTLTATNGAMTLAGTSGLTFTAGDGSADSSMTFTGTASNINTALNGLSFNPTANFNGSATIQIQTNDQGNSGSGGILTDTDTVNITVSSINDAPVNTVPAAQTTNEDTAKVFSSANGNVISVSDIDAGTNPLQVSLTSVNGTMTLGSTTGLTFTSGDGSADSSMIFTGTVSNLNTALNGLSFNPTANINGAASIQIQTNDQGNSGSGGTLTDTDTVSITVNAVNDGPVNTIPSAQTTNEDTAKVFSTSNGNVISVSDIDAGTNPLQVTLTVNNGVISLNSTSGLLFSNGDGLSDSSMTFTGTQSVINTALNGMNFSPNANFNGAVSLQIQTNDQGNSGTGGALFDSDNLAITVNAINDAPVNTVPANQILTEDNAKFFSVANGNAISVNDVDAGINSLRVNLTATNGAMTLGGTTGLTFITGDGTADSTMIFSGTASNINTALENLSFNPTTNYNGVANLQIQTSDQGYTGSGGVLTDTDSISLTVSAVNDAPVNTIPSAQTTNEDTAKIFSNANGNAINVSDVDVGTNSLQVSLTATNGIVNLAGVTGLSFTVGDGTADSSMIFTGSTSSINTALNGLSFNPTADFNGAANLQIQTNDQGYSGSGGTLSDIDTVGITVNAVNDAPVNTVPGAQTTNENTAKVFSSANGNAISINDVDAGTNPLQVTLTASNGLMTLGGTTGLTFTIGDGTADSSMTFTGLVTNINNALNGLSFNPTTNFNGMASIQIQTNDQGYSGSGGVLSDTDTINITVSTVNDAPVNSVPGAQTINEDTAKVFSSANGNAISVSDVDAGTNLLQVTLTATNGVMSLSGTTGLSFTVGDGTADSSMTFTGTTSNINTALNGISFNPTANFNGPANLQIQTNDQGYTGLGGELTDTDSISITVNAVNDAPANTVPVAQITNEDTVKVFSTANGNAISINDVDAGTNPLEVTLSTTNGAMNLSTISGLTFTNGGNNSSNMTISGTSNAINTALQGSSFIPDANFNGAANIQIQTNDQGYSGTGGILTDTDNIGVTVNAINDAPVNTVPTSQITNEDTVKVFSSANGNAISVNDVDVGTNSLQVTLTTTNGVTTLSGTSGLIFTTGDGTSDSSMVFTGTTININTALNGLSFEPVANFNGAASLQIQTSDQGASGSGGTLVDTDTINITVNSINDAPVLMNNQLTVSEGQTVNITSSNLSATDIDNSLSSLNFTITGITHGRFEKITAPGVPLNNFIQQQIIDSEIQFVHDGGQLAPTYNVTVSDGIATTPSSAATIIFDNSVNDSPVLLPTSGSVTYTENTSAVTVASNLNVIDVDSTNLVNATVSITNNFNNAQDILGFTNLANINGNYDNSNGVLTLVGNATISEYQTALRNVTYVNSADNPTVGARTISFVAHDGIDLSAAVTRTVNITPINDAPELNSTTTSTNFVEQVSKIINNNIQLTDIDSPTLTSATVSITNNFNLNEDELSFANQGDGIAGNYDSNTGILTLVGASSVANYQAALRRVHYQNMSNTPTTSPRTIEFRVNDGSANSNIYVNTATITPVNDPPLLGNNQLTLDEGETIVLSTSNLSATDVDNTASELQFIPSEVQHGQFEAVANPGIALTSFTLEQINNGEIVFVHDGGELSPSYKIGLTDSIEPISSPLSGAVSFSPVNDAPMVANPLADQIVTVNEPFSFTVSSDAFVDPEQDTMTYAASTIDDETLPSWIQFDEASRKFSGTAMNVGKSRFSIFANDTSNAQARMNFTIEAKEKSSNEPKQGWLEQTNNIIGLTTGIFGAVATLVSGGIAGYKWWKRKQQKAEQANLELNEMEQGKSGGIAMIGNYSAIAPNRVSKGHTVIQQRYALINKISRDEAKELLAQTGIEVVFASDETRARFTLGKGQFGKLRLAHDLQTDQFIGVKKIKGEQAIQTSQNEGLIQEKLKGSSNVMPLLDYVKTTDANGKPVLYQFMPLAGWGNGEQFAERLATVKDETLKMKLLVEATRHFLTGINNMHKSHIYHLDIKPNNTVIDKQGNLYVIDFGCAQELMEGQLDGGVGDTRYFSPERLANFRHHIGITGPADETASVVNAAKVDAWAVGITLLIWAVNRYPFHQNDMKDKIAEWDSGYVAYRLNQVAVLKKPDANSYFAVIKGLLDPNPETRLTVAEALALPIFQNSIYSFESDEAREKAFTELKQANQAQEDKQPAQPVVKEQEEKHYTSGYGSQQSVQNYQAQEKQQALQSQPREQEDKHYARGYGSQQPGFFQPASNSNNSSSYVNDTEQQVPRPQQ